MTSIQGTTDYTTYSLLLNKRYFGISKIGNVNRKTLSQWRKQGYLSEHRNKVISGKPNYFSPVELIWISIIADLREMCVEHPRIMGAKEGIFAPVKALDGKKYPALEFYMIEVLEMNVAIYIVLTHTNELHIVNDLVYVDMLKSGALENHILVSLNKQIRDALGVVYHIPDFSEYTGLSTQEIEIMEIIRNKAYKYIKITRQDGGVFRLEGTEQITEDIPKVTDLLKKGAFQHIEIKEHNGQVFCINRTIRKKIVK